jgi:trehalose 6-phosphate synthase/phosphatase
VGATPHQDHDGSGNTKNADSYFDDNAKPRSESPTQIAAGARSGEELLRRLSLTHTSPMKDSKDLDPRASHPNLNLSGRIISATFIVPFKLKLVPGGEWVCSRFAQFKRHR